MVVAVSRGVARDVAARSGLPESRIRTIYNPAVGSDTARLAAEPLDDPWFAPGAPPVILAIGNGHLSRTRDSALARALLGHFITIYGYDAERDVFFVYDPYLRGNPTGPVPAGNVERTSEEILRDWRGPFYYRFIGMDHVFLPVSAPTG